MGPADPRGASTGRGPDEPLLALAMGLALEEAALAAADDEVPVGAVLFDGSGRLLARGRNAILAHADPTAHAERLVLSQACAGLGVPRLPPGCLLASTLEPCAMCAGALVLARVDWLVFGAADPKTGACGSRFQIAADPFLNHRVRLLPPRRAAECGAILSRFFQARRPGGGSGC